MRGSIDDSRQLQAFNGRKRLVTVAAEAAALHTTRPGLLQLSRQGSSRVSDCGSFRNRPPATAASTGKIVGPTEENNIDPKLIFKIVESTSAENDRAADNDAYGSA